MEYLDIVDEQGDKTGEVLDRKTAHDLNKLHWEITIYITNGRGQILLEKRSMNKRYSPGKWAPLAGHVASGEEIEDAACREAKEELGLDLRPADLVIMEKGLLRKREENSRISRYFYTVCDKDANDFTIQEEELTDVRWFDIDEVIRMAQSDDNPTSFHADRVYLLEKMKKDLKEQGWKR
jgi:8-oxo-dGTP pyrophosphatase MutT (NUDIX family)